MPFTTQDSFHLLDKVSLGILLIDNGYNVIYWNSVMERWTGLSKQEMDGKSLINTFPYINQAKFTERIKTIFNGGLYVVRTSRTNGPKS